MTFMIGNCYPPTYTPEGYCRVIRMCRDETWMVCATDADCNTGDACIDAPDQQCRPGDCCDMDERANPNAGFYDDETARFVDAFTRVFEPLLMTVLGLAVGLIVVLMYMPVFELAGSLR